MHFPREIAEKKKDTTEDFLGIRWKRNFALSLIGLSSCLAAFNNCSGGFKPVQTLSQFSTLADSALTCTPGVAPPPDTELRLTGKQFQNTVRTLVNEGADTYSVSVFYSTQDMRILLDSFPMEGSYDKGDAMIYDTADQRILSSLIHAQTSLVLNLSQWLIADSARLTRFVNYYGGTANCAGTIANKGASASCVEDFIKGFGLRALRRPVETTNNPIDGGGPDAAAANDLQFYRSIYNDPTNGGFDTLFAAMMLSPDSLFLNHVKGTGSNVITLSNYELAAKLSYYMTDNTPDLALLTAAAAGFEGAGKTLEEQSNRLFASAGARTRFAAFFRQWIRPAAIPQLSNASNAPPNTYLYGLRENAINEMVDLTEYYTFGVANGKLSDILTSDISFAKTTDLAGLYGVAPWPGKNNDQSYDPAKLVRFPANQPRAGLFTRAGYAFSGARDNNPIIRGARLRKDYFCENLNPPAAFELNHDITLQGPPTVRNIVAANTEIAGTSCAGCHKAYINPLGFALENYDSFGRYRETESIFNPDGTLKETAPVDAASTPFASAGNNMQTHNGVEFSHLLADNQKFNACFVRHYFRFAQARSENNAADGCKLSKLETALADDPSNSSLQNMIKTFAADPLFKLRGINP